MLCRLVRAALTTHARAQGGELLDALLARGRSEAAAAGGGPPPAAPYSEGEARAIFRQVVDGVRFMHAQ